MASGRTIESTGSLVEEETFARTREIGRNGVGKMFANPLAISISPRPVEGSNVTRSLPREIDRNCGAGAGCGKGESSVREILNRERSRN